MQIPLKAAWLSLPPPTHSLNIHSTARKLLLPLILFFQFYACKNFQFMNFHSLSASILGAHWTLFPVEF
jgi:hypothetical protein